MGGQDKVANDLGGKKKKRGTWVALSVKRPTLDFGSGRDLLVHGIEPRANSAKSAWDFLSYPSLSASPPLAHVGMCSPSLKINK